MRERKDGCFLVTTGATAYMPMASHANGAVSQSALCSYIKMLYDKCDMDNVYVGSICIGAPKDDVFLADKYWQMCQERNECEYIYGNIKPTIAYQYYVNRGFGMAYPPMFIKEPITPKTKEDRDRLVLALWNAHISADSVVALVLSKEQAEQSKEFTLKEAAKYGAKFDEPYWGAKGE